MRRTAAALPRVKSASKLRSGQAPLIKNRGVLFGLSKPKLRRQPSSPRRKPSCSASGSASGFWCAYFSPQRKLAVCLARKRLPHWRSNLLRESQVCEC
jgi:hypothetical protein